MKRIQIGLLPSSIRNDMLFNLLNDIGDVTYLTPFEKKAHYDIIVLPDGMGISPNLPCFSIGEVTRIPTNPIDTTIEVFRVHSLPYYMDKGITILGLGDNAALLYNELGQKVAVTSLGIQLIRGDLDIRHILGFSDVFVNAFTYGDLIGIVEYKQILAGVLRGIKARILAESAEDIKRIEDQEDNEEGVGPSVPKTPTTPPARVRRI